jgi:hypothetical protein
MSIPTRPIGGDAQFVIANPKADGAIPSVRHLKSKNRSKASGGATPHALAQAMNSVTSTRRLAVS